MSIKEREKELFNALTETSGRKVVRDGIVNETEWLSSRIKCVFVLKEAVGERVSDLSKDLAEGSKKSHPTWCNIARWAYTICNIDKDLDYKTDVKGIGTSKDKRKEWLSKIVTINVKKHSGTSRTKTKRLKESFETYYADFLSEQLKLYADADVIICCGKGVFGCLTTIFDNAFGEAFDKKKSIEFDKEEHHKFYRLGTADDYKGVFKKGTLIIDYWHPAASKNRKMMNNQLRDIIRKELEIRDDF